ncbi:hypothetical protein ABW636_20430 [Aquimarina sp. 2201CG1-2-11]|uniref:hypothetical protein n=1 Tax=Aquimarina discodermiae TaxID=3231043 RepID=UPI0034637EBB
MSIFRSRRKKIKNVLQKQRIVLSEVINRYNNTYEDCIPFRKDRYVYDIER